MAPSPPPPDLLVVIGVGGMGEAVVRDLAPGRAVLLADREQAALDRATGFAGSAAELHTRTVDLAAPSDITGLTDAAARLGPVETLVLTAGLSPVQAPADAIVDVDLIGLAHTLEDFAPRMADGGAGVVIASMAGHLMGPLDADDAPLVATTPAADLAEVPRVAAARAGDAGSAYAFAKAAAMVRVQAAAGPWGEFGARINSISPGIIDTPMGQAELASEVGPVMEAMTESSAAGRLGTPEDIAAAVRFLVGPEAAFVTGTDLLVDGGVVAATRTG